MCVLSVDIKLVFSVLQFVAVYFSVLQFMLVFSVLVTRCHV